MLQGQVTRFLWVTWEASLSHAELSEDSIMGRVEFSNAAFESLFKL